jgi:hypothetical protein
MSQDTKGFALVTGSSDPQIAPQVRELPQLSNASPTSSAIPTPSCAADATGGDPEADLPLQFCGWVRV